MRLPPSARQGARVALLALLVCAGPASSHARPALAEQEPNDDVASAQAIAIADTIDATTGSESDADWFAFDVVAGERLRIRATAVDYGIDLALLLFDESGDSLLASNDDYRSGVDPLVVWTPDSNQRVSLVVIEVSSEDFGAGYPYEYELTVERMPVEEADPGTLVFPRLFTQGLAAGPHGEILVTRGQSDIDVLPAGVDPDFRHSISLFGWSPIRGVTHDAFGRILALAQGIVVRVDTIFEFGYRGIVEHQLDMDCDECFHPPVLDAAGNVLVQIEPGVVALFEPLLEVEMSRYTLSTDPYNALGAMAFAPDGDLLYMDVDRTLLRSVRLPATTPNATFIAPSRIAGFAVDSLGYVYAPTEWHGLLRISPDLSAWETVAWDSIGRAIAAFRTDTEGNPTDRLLVAATDFPLGGVYEFAGAALARGHRAGPRLRVVATVPPADFGAAYVASLGLAEGPPATGWTVRSGALPAGLSLQNGAITGSPAEAGTFEVLIEARRGADFGLALLSIQVDPPAGVSAEAIAAHLMGAAELSAADLAFVDDHGNGNGEVDLGDLVLFERRFTEADPAMLPDADIDDGTFTTEGAP